MRIAIPVALILLAGCTVGPSYHPPKLALPPTYDGPSATGPATTGITAWWAAFDDPVLDDLLARARSGNLDMRQAAVRVEEARAQERGTRASGGPTVNVSGQAGYSRLSSNSLPSALSSLGTLGSGSSSSNSGGLGLAGEHFATFQTGFDASWELDLFGGQRRANEAASARTQAAEWSARDAEVTLVAEVGNTYQQLRALQRRIAVADQAIAAARDTLDVIRARMANGLVTSLDERREEQDLAQTIAGREDMVAQADADVHALGTLLGLAPAALKQELATPAPAEPTVVEVPAGLPSDLLERRPDIRAAERQLAAATADIGVATADLYPKFSLTGAAQLASRSLSNLLQSDSTQANAAGRLSMPLIGRGATLATVRLRKAQANEALVAYQRSVLTALRDVEDALTRLDADRRRVVDLTTSARAASDAADTGQVRFRHGLVAYTDVLDAQRTALSAHDALVQAQAAAAQDVIALYKALGGGWDERRMQKQEEGSRGRDN